MSLVTDPVILDSTGQDIATQLATISAALAAGNVITGNTDTTLSGVLQGANGKVAVKPVDSAPTADSTNLVSSGGTYKAIKGRVPVYGLGKNLLDNWYFVGGGSQLGDGVFPVNQRGQTQYTGAVYGIDRWKGANAYGNIKVTSTGLTLTSVANAFFAIDQITQNANQFVGKSVTISCLLASGLFAQGTAVVPSSDSIFIQIVSGILVIELSKSSGVLASRIRVQNYNTVDVVAVKLELGTEQTLCHNEGTAEAPVWVLNEVPDYEYELYRCMTSTADPSDTYANKTLATGEELAYVENGTTASQNYTAGQYICWNGLFYTANQAISSGTTLSDASGGNLTEVTVGSELYKRPKYTHYYLNSVGSSVDHHIPVESMVIVFSSISNSGTTAGSSLYYGVIHATNANYSIVIQANAGADPCTVTGGAGKITITAGRPYTHTTVMEFPTA